ncbi:MAG: DNA-binding transcriptional regulator Fis [Gammaproteobacteria bacterium]|nr:DNA-binding transcriptional regulator Fis [Gammaproteobacteria bacterium]
MKLTRPRERRKQPIRRSVTSAIELYLGDLEGHKVHDLYHVVMNEVEPAILGVVMEYVEGNQTQAAEMLGISRGTLRKKLNQYEIETGNSD